LKDENVLPTAFNESLEQVNKLSADCSFIR
jgi:hypothetical protein